MASCRIISFSVLNHTVIVNDVTWWSVSVCHTIVSIKLEYWCEKVVISWDILMWKLNLLWDIFGAKKSSFYGASWCKKLSYMRRFWCKKSSFYEAFDVKSRPLWGIFGVQVGGKSAEVTRWLTQGEGWKSVLSCVIHFARSETGPAGVTLEWRECADTIGTVGLPVPWTGHFQC